MKLPPQSQLTDAKYQSILTLIDELKINLDDIDEKFIHGGGHGGQKINKSTNTVQLKHLTTGTTVKYQKHRQRAMNRILALRELLEKLNPDSKKQQGIERVRKQKARQKRRRQEGGK
ncbi:peptide chain release factor-like protein [Candidatus Peregrinibacteria bacterium CG_4_10_14_0_2_um_filter_43_11]|nr:MAG: peptide chain release factor-like protein [Candidatus Peregrinibacteria bacterium CG_4_10_14_0_2_um_filter_43_11]